MTAAPNRTVLVLLHEEALGGATRAVLRAEPLLRARGWQLVFWVSRPSLLHDELSAAGFEVHGAPRTVGYSLRALRAEPGPLWRLGRLPGYLAALGGLIRQRSPALVHANTLYTLAEASFARALGSTVLLHVHEIVPAGLKGGAARRLAVAVARERVAVSQASATSLRAGTFPVRVVFGGAQLPAEPAQIRPAPRPFVVGTVGVVSPRKGTDLFVEAVRRLRREGVEAEFRIVGASRDPFDPGWGRRVLDDARALGIEQRDSAEVFEELRAWDAFVLPSRADPFPLAMLDAMALGLPVIGARSGGIPEQVTPACGILVPPDDADALARAMAELLSASYERRAAMGAAGRERVRANFTVDHQAARLETAYRAATGAD